MTKLDPTGSALVYSTYLGGSKQDIGYGIAVDGSGAYVAGLASSTNFPTANALQPTYGGSTDAFVTKLNLSGSGFYYSTYLGGSADDRAFGIAADGLGDMFVTGQTSSTAFITSTDALQPGYGGGSSDAFVTWLDPGRSGADSLVYSSYLGGSGDDSGHGIAVDGQDNAALTGSTTGNFPLANAQQGADGGGSDAFVTKIGATPDCPEGWACDDVGSPDLAGDQMVSGQQIANATWAVQGAGADIGGASDQFHFIDQALAGDGTISTQVVSQANTDPAAKAGVMIRESTDPAAPFYAVYKTPGSGVVVQYRAVAGGSVAQAAQTAASLPIYIRVGRAGGQFTAYTSGDGQTWTPLAGSQESIGMQPDALLGLALTSHNAGTLGNATFAAVRAGTCPGGWSCADVGSPAAAGSQSLVGDQTLDGDGAFTVAGSGAGVGGTADHFRFVDQPVSGDGGITARVSGQQNTAGCAKADVMYRADDSDPGAVSFAVVAEPHCGSGTASVEVIARSTEGGGSASVVSVPHALPVYLRAVRSGASFTAYASGDGESWSALTTAAVTIAAMPTTALAGLAVTSNNDGVLSSASFDNVRLGACPDGYSCSDVGGASLPGSQSSEEGLWALQSAGATSGALPDIGGTSDQFRFVAQSVTGDSGMSARLIAQTYPAGCAKAGLMDRASADPGAASYAVVVAPHCPAGGYAGATSALQVQYRPSQGAATVIAATVAVTLPVYLQVVRGGATFTAYTSSDGLSYTPIAGSGVAIGAIPGTALLGFAASGDALGAQGTALFDTADVTGTIGAAPAAGTDLAALDTDTAHFTQGDNGQVHAQIYNSPVGVVTENGWSVRDTTLGPVTTTGMLAPANLPMTEQLASSSGGMTATASSAPALAALTSEDGVTLSVGLAATPTPQATGQVQSNAVTYNAAAGPGGGGGGTSSDLALRVTAAGLDARVVLHSASETGPFTVTLATSPQAQLAQDASGAIRVTQAITSVGDDEVSSDVVTQTEYVLQPPLLTDSSSAITAAVSSGPATATLTTVAGAPAVTLSVDPAWLADPGRVFPATLDLPIVTSAAGAQTGPFGTVSSCAPNVPAPLGRVVVGTANGCAYNGQVYFDLSALPDSASIVSATLRLYTPDAITATGVQADQNAGLPLGADLSQPPNWSSAPAISGTTGIAQSGSDGHWQSWDVTGLAQQWAQDSTTNGGLTLVSGGTPVRFASPQGAGGDGPALAPYLDVTYAPAASPPAAYGDGAPNIYGVSGSFTISKSYRGAPLDLPANCGPEDVCSGNIRINDVTAKHPKGAKGVKALGSAFIRFGVQMYCSSLGDTPGPSWWNNRIEERLRNGNDGSAFDLMRAAYKNGLIPVVNFIIPDPDVKDPDSVSDYTKCPKFGPGTTGYADHWKAEMSDFVNSLPSDLTGPNGLLRFTYFEIGNEQNIHNVAYYGKHGENYPPLFAAAAKGLYGALQGAGITNYRIITDGVIRPQASRYESGPYACPDSTGTAQGTFNHDIAATAINDAATGTGAVPYAQLGLGAHPYHFATNNTFYWRNYYTEYGFHTIFNGRRDILRNSYPGPCGDLQGMVSLWTNPASYQGHRLPVVFTEDNWSAQPHVVLDPTSGQYCADSNGCEGAYEADLFTWLYDKGYAVGGAARTATVPLRVAWYRGADKGSDLLGLFHGAGKAKQVHLHTCGTRPPDTVDTDDGVLPPTNDHLVTFYNQHRHSGCYGQPTP